MIYDPNSPGPLFPEWYVRRVKRADHIAECIVAVMALVILAILF